MTSDRMIKRIRSYKAVSFDVFDTLIQRDVIHPYDIFLETGKRGLGDDMAEDFRFNRIYAEKKARKVSEMGEVTLNEIYNHLNSYESEKKQELQETELEVELASCSCKQEMFDVFSWACEHVPYVVIVSDMYLSSVHIAEMLRKCGYDGYKKIYVSNEYGVNKISGRLFTTVLGDLGISKEKMIHIGDSIKADFIGARKVGIDSVLVNRKNRIIRKLC